MKEVKKRMLRRIMAAALSLAMVFSSVQTMPGLSMTALAAESTPETPDLAESTVETGDSDQTEVQAPAATEGEDASGKEDSTEDSNGSEAGDASGDNADTSDEGDNAEAPDTSDEGNGAEAPDTSDNGDGTETPDTSDDGAVTPETPEEGDVPGTDVSGETGTDAVEAEEVTLKLHFKNTENWPTVCIHHWDVGGGSTQWPGDELQPDADNASYYTYTTTKTKAQNFGYIFNNGGNGKQTADLMLDVSTVTGDTYEAWAVWPEGATGKPGADEIVTTTPPSDWSGSEDPGDKVVSPEVNGKEVTFRYKDEAANEVYVAGTMNSWSTTADKMVKGDDGVFSLTKTLDMGAHEYKFVVDGEWINDPNNGQTAANGNNLVVVTGIYDEEIDVTKGEPNKLPAKLRRLTEDGETDEYVAVTYATKEASVAGVTIEGNQITISADYAEETLELTATATVGEKTETGTLTLNIVATKLTSPEVQGNKVTFRYQDADAAKVSVVYGDDLTTEEMTKAADSDVFSCEVELAAGKYLYQFDVDGTKKKDPKNIRTEKGKSVVYVAGLSVAKFNVAKNKTTILPEQMTMLTEDGEETEVDVTYALKADVAGVSIDAAGKAITVGDYTGAIELTAKATVDTQEYTVDLTVNAVEDTNKITMNLHYHRADNTYDDWHIWGWMTGAGGAWCEFTAGTDEVVYTREFEDARAVDAFNYIITKGEWADREDFGDRLVDLSDILCGTVDFYVESGEKEGTRVLGEDVLTGAKVLSAAYDKTTKNIINVKTGLPIVGSIDGVFTVTANSEPVSVTKVTADENVYAIEVEADLSTVEEQSKSWVLNFDGHDYKINMPSAYSSEAFEEKYTYTGNDLGATWTSDKTTFKVWAPTADQVEVFLYDSGVKGEGEPEKIEMTAGEQGVWSVEKAGDIQGKFYTYNVTIGSESKEACDPYARTTGVNGDRAMVIDLDATDPEGWAGDAGPNATSYTDSVIYELHVRDFSIDESSGITNKGKFLGLTEKGTTNSEGQTTGLDYLVDLGVNYVHLLPSYDYATVDETKLDTPQYNWGYDPKNYNVPEGSYSTDPYKGEVRVNEMKQMVKALHDNNINVIMDVVYNHVYSGDDFCFNQIVPQYFSRVDDSGKYSNGSGCGNDTASERSMVKKYIVDSVNYWADEYHIDGFRFDLVGLLDTETVNEIVSTVHAKHPNVIFYGEGWDMTTEVTKDGYTMATQKNSAQTPGFAYFSDNMRDMLKGSVFEAEGAGFVSGAAGKATDVVNNFMANPGWSSDPTQIVNYASCHDNYTLWDKLQLSTDVSEADRIKMNNLAAAIYMTAEGIPFIHAGEELLRTKVKEDGSLEHNSYNSPDSVNSIKWDDLNDATYRKVRDYYKGLIDFRQNHPALRLSSAQDVKNNVKSKVLGDQTVMFVINGKGSVSGEISDEIVVIFNAATSEQTVDLYANGATEGSWQVCINEKKAGTRELANVTDGQITVAPISAMVLVKGGADAPDPDEMDRGYQVTFDYNCDEIAPVTIEVEPGALITAADMAKVVTAERDGYSLQAQWYKDAEYKKQWNFETDTVQADTTLYGLWLKESDETLKATSLIVQEIRPQTYTGSQLKPSVIVYADVVNKDGRTERVQLQANKDYKVTYKNNINACVITDGKKTEVMDSAYKNAATKPKNQWSTRPYVEIKGNGSYSGYVYQEFEILPADISGAALKYNAQAVENTNTKVVTSLKYKKALKEGTDFDVAVTDKEGTTVAKTADKKAATVKAAAGVYTMTITAKGNYKGTVTGEIIVAGKNQLMQKAAVAVKAKTKDWTGEEVKLAAGEYTVKLAGQTLTEGRDYKVSYRNNVNVGTATMIVTGLESRAEGAVYCTGTKEATFKIKGTGFTAAGTKATITVSENGTKTDGKKLADMAYTGKPVTKSGIELTSPQRDGGALVLGRDYTITYKNNLKKGKATVTFTATEQSGFTGKFAMTFQIGAASLAEAVTDISGATKDEASKTWKADAEVPYTPAGAKLPAVTLYNKDGVALKEKTDYTVVYDKNTNYKAPGEVSVTLKGKGNYTGELKIGFTIEKAAVGNLTITTKAMQYNPNNTTKNYEPAVTVKYGNKALKGKGNNADYKVDYINNTPEAVKAYLDYRNDPEQKVTAEQEAKLAPQATITLLNENYVTNGEGSSRTVALTIFEKEKKLTAKNVKVNFIDEKHYYEGGLPIRPRYTSITFNGKPLSEEVQVKDGRRIYREDLNYDITWGANNKTGKGTMKITGKGIYTGTVTVKFDIEKKPVNRKVTQNLIVDKLTYDWYIDALIQADLVEALNTVQDKTEASYNPGNNTATVYLLPAARELKIKETLDQWIKDNETKYADRLNDLRWDAQTAFEDDLKDAKRIDLRLEGSFEKLDLVGGTIDKATIDPRTRTIENPGKYAEDDRKDTETPELIAKVKEKYAEMYDEMVKKVEDKYGLQLDTFGHAPRVGDFVATATIVYKDGTTMELSYTVHFEQKPEEKPAD